ncbi:hypothetical protein M569_05790, partial [Genlisea aurea]
MDLSLNLEATELRLGLPGGDEMRSSASTSSLFHIKRSSSEIEKNSSNGSCPVQKQQVVGWPPVRSFRKNALLQQGRKDDSENGSGIFVKVSMDGAPYLRKIDLRFYKNYSDLLKALEDMFKCKIGKSVYSEMEGYNASEYAPTYEDKDGDWMLAGDVPWEMFVTCCRRMRIMRASEAKGLGGG